MPLDIHRIKALCFDLDGTLSDTDDAFVNRLSGWLQHVRRLFPDNDPRPFARRLVMATEGPGNFAWVMADWLGIDSKLAALGDWIYRLGIGHSTKPFLLIPGVLDLLTCLQPRYPMAIVSARGELSSMAFIKQYHLESFFYCIATSQTCRHTKPYPDPIFWAAKQMSVAPESCLMIGDTTADVRAGRAARAQTVGVLCGFGELSELQQCGADLILPSTGELTKLLCRE
jgi:phosphoglycolate phosphatase-like HAD superfamily hydrolase